jgi:hypothetical protein
MAPAKKTSAAKKNTAAKKTTASRERDPRGGRKKGEYVPLERGAFKEAVERYLANHPRTTQKELYEDLGVSASNWARLMNGKGSPHRTTYHLAVQLLGPIRALEGWDQEGVSWVVLEKLDRIESLLRSIASPGITPEAQAEARALLDQAARTLGLESAQTGELRNAPGRLQERRS